MFYLYHVHRTNSSIFNELQLPMNWLYNVVRCQQLKYFGHVTRHNGLEKTIMQGMVAGKRSSGKPRQKQEKEFTDIFGKMATSCIVAASISQRHLGSDVLTRICPQKKHVYTICATITSSPGFSFLSSHAGCVLTISVFICRFKTSNLEHIIEVRLYDEIDFVCPHFHSSTDPTAYEYYIIHQVRSGTFVLNHSPCASWDISSAVVV